MADNDLAAEGSSSQYSSVQIPLWPIMTGMLQQFIQVYFCSDSSMADNDGEIFMKNVGFNEVQIPLWPIMTFRLSSMHLLRLLVQIPLWPIMTHRRPATGDMVSWFRFLYGR